MSCSKLSRPSMRSGGDPCCPVARLIRRMGLQGVARDPCVSGSLPRIFPPSRSLHERRPEGSFIIPTGPLPAPLATPHRAPDTLSKRRRRVAGASSSTAHRPNPPYGRNPSSGATRQHSRARSPQPSNGCTGRTVDTNSNPSGMCLRPNSRRTRHRRLRKPVVAARLAQINPRDSRGVSFGTRPGEAVGKAARNSLQ